MARVWSGIESVARDRYAAITGLCAFPDGRVVGDLYPRDVMDATSLDLTFRYGVGGEKLGCMRTAVLRRFHFPEEIPGSVTESLVWRAIARAGYQNRFGHPVFRVYNDSEDSIAGPGRD